MEENVENRQSGSESEVEDIEFDPKQIDDIVGYVKKQLESVNHCASSTNRDQPYIRRVPDKLQNLVACGPWVLHIGLHNYRSDCMVWRGDEGEKMVYLVKFLERIKKRARVKDLVHLILYNHRRVIDYYDSHYIDKSLLSRYRDFVYLLLRDAAIIIELFLRDYRKENDFSEKWKKHVIRNDLMLVEHQLPFFILSKIYKLAATTEAAEGSVSPDFIHLTCHFFRRYCVQNKSLSEIVSASRVGDLHQPKHFTDILRALQLPCSRTKDRRLKADQEQEQDEYLYSAVPLREAGVKFKVDASRTLCDVSFNERSGELIIPGPLVIDDSTDSFFRNLMTWEQMHYYPHETYVCSYVFLMAFLMQSVEDVDLLVQRRIIINQLDSKKAIVTLFNNFCRAFEVEKNHFSGLFWKINAYNAVRHHSWIAILKLTLWRGVATIAAVILLLFLILTICSVISII